MQLKHVGRADVAHIADASVEQRGRWHALGDAAYKARQVMHVVLAGGAATRFGGGAKALLEIEPGVRLLDKFLWWPEIAPMDLLFMTSRATHAALYEAIGNRPHPLFQQFESPRLTLKGELFRDQTGCVQFSPTGHGDMPDALRVSGHLGAFLARGGKYVVMHNIDNYASVPDRTLLGQHIDSGKNVSVELVERLATDVGGAPMWVDDKIEIVEKFRLPADVDATQASFHNTNTLTFNASILDRSYPWTFFMVQKQVNDTPVVQRERLIQEMTQWWDTNYRVVDRNRFLAIKTQIDLQNLQAPPSAR